MILLHCSIYSLLQAQCKNAVLEAEMAKLKAKIIVLENTEGKKRQYDSVTLFYIFSVTGSV